MILWPAYGLALLYPSFTSLVTSSEFVHDGEPDSALFTNAQNLLVGLKGLLSTLPRTQAAKNYAVYERYAELGLILSSSYSQSPKFHDLLAAAGHPNGRIGGRCLERRNREDVLKHQRSARSGVVDLVQTLSSDQEMVRKTVFDLLGLLDTDTQTDRLGLRPAGVMVEQWKNIEVPSLENAMNTKS